MSEVRVQLDVFSGRPNPDWPLADDEFDALVQKVRRLSTERAPASVARLGYRGFAVYRGDRSRGLWLHVVDGSVTVFDDRGARTYDDSERIEPWLQKLARVHGIEAPVPHDPEEADVREE